MKNYNVASIVPEIVDAEILYLVLGVTAKYNSTVTEKAKSDIKALVVRTISSFNSNNLQKFDSVFRHSNLLKDIDETDTSILSSTATLKLKRVVTPTLNAITKYTVSFNNAVYHPAASWSQTVVESTGFYLFGNTNEQFIDDDGNGKLRTFYLLGGTTKTITNAEAGTVNYNTGVVVLTSFNITSVTNADGTINVTVKPDSNDVIPAVSYTHLTLPTIYSV